MNKLNYIAHTLLNTKYKIVLFLMFYFICIKLHYWDINTIDCMRAFNIPTNKIEYERLLKWESDTYFAGIEQLNQQLSTKDTLINELQSARTIAPTSTDVTQQLHEMRASLQNLTERLNAQEANIHNRSNINSETITSTNNCTIN